MTRHELIDAVRRLEGGKLSEAERDVLLGFLMAAVPHASISDLIYHSDPELTAEEIADEALRRERKWTETAI